MRLRTTQHNRHQELQLLPVILLVLVTLGLVLKSASVLLLEIPSIRLACLSLLEFDRELLRETTRETD